MNVMVIFEMYFEMGNVINSQMKIKGICIFEQFRKIQVEMEQLFTVKISCSEKKSYNHTFQAIYFFALYNF